MKTKVRRISNSFFKLIMQEPGVPAKEQAVLAVFTHYEGTGCWTLEDLRLKKHAQATPYFNAGAVDYQSHMQPESPAQSQAVCALLREYLIEPVGAVQPDQASVAGGPQPEPTLVWCTFEGIVRGRPSSEVDPRVGMPIAHDFPVCHSRAEGMDKLKAIAQFWEQWPHSENDPDIRKRVSAVKIDNPWRQPSEDTINFGILLQRLPQQPQHSIDSMAASRIAADTLESRARQEQDHHRQALDSFLISAKGQNLPMRFAEMNCTGTVFEDDETEEVWRSWKRKSQEKPGEQEPAQPAQLAAGKPPRL